VFTDYAPLDPGKTDDPWFLPTPRPNTTDISIGTVSHVSVRSSPLWPRSVDEINRITEPNGVVTIAGSCDYIKKLRRDILNGKSKFDACFIGHIKTVSLPNRGLYGDSGEIKDYFPEEKNCVFSIRINCCP
jgi:hypothetical protein